MEEPEFLAQSSEPRNRPNWHYNLDGPLQGALARTLFSTNPIENLMGTLERVSGNVKRWRHGRMALRWAVTGLLEARKTFRRVKGHRELPALLRALDARVASHRGNGIRTEDVA
jgi:hypothetical protein